jgi:drug/metabolite transporter (DMT)-like permease
VSVASLPGLGAGGRAPGTRRGAEAALAANTFLWGATFILVKAALHDVSAGLFLALRFSLAAVVLALLFRRKLSRLSWGGALAGLLLFAGFFFQTQGLRFTTAPKSAFLTGLTTVMVPLVAALVYRVRPRLSEVVGVMVATLGMGLMTLQGPIGSIGRGDVLTLFGAIAFAGHIVTLGHFSERESFELLSVTQIGAAALASVSLFWWVETPRIDWQPVVVCAILVTGLLCTALAFTIQSWAQRYTTSTRTALIYALEPVVAWVTSFVVAGEGLSGRGAVGAAFILSGVVLVEVKPLNPRPHPNE